MGNKKGRMLEERLLEQVFQFVTQKGLLPSGEKVVVGVSGGPDSLCLAHILFRLQDPLGIELHLAHLNHGLRGQQAVEDSRCVADIAAALGLPLTIGRADVVRVRSEGKLSWEEAARQARYCFLADVAQMVGACRVAVGHTADDQAETILMNIVRGTGAWGLRGMQAAAPWPYPPRAITLIRPLIAATRREAEEYCQIHQLEPRRDLSNLSPEYVRNRVRMELMPMLRTYNPRITEALLRLGKEAGDDAAFVERQGEKILGEVAEVEDQGITFDLEAVVKLPKVLKCHLVRAAIRSLLGEVMDIGAVHIEAVAVAMSKGPGRTVMLPRGLVFTTSYNTAALTLGPLPAPSLPIIDGEYPLVIPGQVSFGGWRVCGMLERPAPCQAVGDPFEARLDYDAAGPEVVVRSRRPGDRFQPLGMDNPKKLQDFMVDCKIPRLLRDRVPIVVSPQQILWVAGWRIDERVKVTQATKRVLVLRFQRDDG